MKILVRDGFSVNVPPRHKFSGGSSIPQELLTADMIKGLLAKGFIDLQKEPADEVYEEVHTSVRMDEHGAD